MFEAVDSSYLVPFTGDFQLGERATRPPSGADEEEPNRARLKEDKRELRALQKILYAHDHHAVLLVFQAMDAAGKDGTIRAVLGGLDPTGLNVSSFKVPTRVELEHDFLWRTSLRLPERGEIGVFNRSYYEEVLVVRVHPGLLEPQRLVRDVPREELWEERMDSIRDHERHLARNGTLILKFFLNVSRDEQRRRFLDRLNEPGKWWKFRPGDVDERLHWAKYMAAYEQALRATSRPWAPWYAIPADDKPYMRRAVADILVRSLRTLNLRYPEVRPEDEVRFTELRRLLEEDTEGRDQG
ncbi:MAG: polyphosphate kinase 2 family protein [Gemmatimonadales bacterium]|nr:MAG: polyphosphate kinase 2 family protein [Gemmatimonadales bacterium]